MIEIASGNLFDSGCEALVNPVNCVGTMGKGLSKQFADRFPSILPRYKNACNRGKLTPGGTLSIIPAELGLFGATRLIINVATKQHWRHPSKLAWIEDGIFSIINDIGLYSIRSVAIPAIGCGYGGLNWDDVLAMLTISFRVVVVRVKVYGPQEGAKTPLFPE